MKRQLSKIALVLVSPFILAQFAVMVYASTTYVGQLTQGVSGTFWQATQPVSGTFWQATQPVSGTFWQATQPVSWPAVSAPAITKVGATTTSAQLIAANATRKGIQIKTDCANTDSVAINYGAGAAVYASHDQLPPCTSYEPPPGVIVTSAIQVISNTGTQNVRVVEYP